MENDGFLEFKWKGDQFLIFLFHAAFASSHSQILPLLCLSNGQRGRTGEPEAERREEKKRKGEAICAAAAGRMVSSDSGSESLDLCIQP